MQIIYLGDCSPIETKKTKVSDTGFWFYMHKHIYFLSFYNTNCLIKIYSRELFVDITKKKKVTFPYILPNLIYQHIHIESKYFPYLQRETFHNFYFRYEIPFFTCCYLCQLRFCGVEDISRIILRYLLYVMIYYYDI